MNWNYEMCDTVADGNAEALLSALLRIQSMTLQAG
jgi:hypothetical protein